MVAWGFISTACNEPHLQEEKEGEREHGTGLGVRGAL